MSQQAAHQKAAARFRTPKPQSKHVPQPFVRSQVEYMVPAQLRGPVDISSLVNWVDRDRAGGAVAARARGKGLVISDPAIQTQSPATETRDPRVEQREVARQRHGIEQILLVGETGQPRVRK